MNKIIDISVYTVSYSMQLAIEKGKKKTGEKYQQTQSVTTHKKFYDTLVFCSEIKHMCTAQKPSQKCQSLSQSYLMGSLWARFMMR